MFIYYLVWCWSSYTKDINFDLSKLLIFAVSFTAIWTWFAEVCYSWKKDDIG